MDVFSGGRVDAGEFAVRINTAADLVAAGMPTIEAIRELSERFGVSTRQARRYLGRAKVTGPVAVPQPTVVFTVKLPVCLTAQVRAWAHETETTISALVTEALTRHLHPGCRQSPRP